MKIEVRPVMAVGLLAVGAAVVAGAWLLPDKTPFVALATLWLRELSAVRSVIFPTRSDEARS